MNPKESESMDKGVVSGSIPILDDAERAWDAGAALKRAKAWASNDAGEIDFNQYRKIFFWFDSENADKQSGYKLPYGDIIDGSPKAIWSGVSAAMGALLGARGGVSLPDSDRQPVYNAIKKYYKKFDKEPPEFKAIVTGDEDEPIPDDEPDEPEPEKLRVKATYDAEKKIAVASTDVEDRHGEKIDQNGWSLKNFKNNPVLLWAHDHTEISVGNARNIHIDRTGERPKLVFTPDFHDATDKARALKTLYSEGRLNSFSVGFLPKEMDGATSTYLKQELLEISAVNVPANPEAMMLAYKSLQGAGIKEEVIAELGIKKMDDAKMKAHVATMSKALKGIMDEMGKDASKGAVADELAQDAAMEKKMNAMEDVWEVFYAFCGVFYDEKTSVDAFPKLLAETVGLLQKIIDGTYPEDEPEEETISASIPQIDRAGLDKLRVAYFNQEPDVLDKFTTLSDSINKLSNDIAQLVKVPIPATAPEAPSATTPRRTEQSLIKVIGRVSDRILEGERHGQEQDERIKYQKVIKRAAEILSKNNKLKV